METTMTDRFANLTKACGGSLTIESLTEFQLAMREYEIFMSGMREMLAPVETPPGFMELAGSGIERNAR
jgi:hypothetical protein